MATRECYLAMMSLDEQVQTMSIEERRVVAEPTKVLEDVLLQEDDPKIHQNWNKYEGESEKRPHPVPEEEY